MEAIVSKDNNPWIVPVFIFLFFFNTFLLPEGVTYSLLLTPVWIFVLHKNGQLKHLGGLIIVFLLYALIHFWLGIIFHYYLISTTLLLCIGVFVLMTAFLLRDGRIDLEVIFKKILILNFLFTLVSLVLLYIPPLKSLVWYSMSMSDQLGVVARLKLFTYEASHYSYLLAPVAIFYYCKSLFGHTDRPWIAPLMISFPLLLSLSFGVLGCLLFASFFTLAVNYSKIFDSRRKKRILWLTCGLLLLTLVLLYFFYPENLLFIRISNIFSGKDTSFRGRTYESFILAHKIVAHKSYLWGIGPGQLKVFGREIIIQYYFYSNIPSTIRIPNASAETIVCFGYVGFVLRLSIQIFLFIVTRVYRNPCRLWLFLFLFLFQFMGSYITNPAEYVFWVLAFSKVLDPLFGPRAPLGARCL